MRQHLFSAMVAFLLTVLVGRAAALTWTGENIADANTIALYHFNEGSGTAAASTVAGRPNINLTADNLWSADTGWLGAAGGMSLSNRNADGTGRAQAYIGQTATLQSIDWSLPGITISFWMKDTVNLDIDNRPVDLGHDGWRNLQATFAYHTQWANGYARMAGRNAPERPTNTPGAHPWVSLIANGAWHHVALVWDNETDTGKLYIDNVQQQLGKDADGNPVMSWSTAGGYASVVNELMTIGNFAGSMDELLIQGAVMTDFSDGLNVQVPEPGSIGLGSLIAAGLLRRRRMGR